jgi:hypothetical protein
MPARGAVVFRGLLLLLVPNIAYTFRRRYAAFWIATKTYRGLAHHG